MTMMITTVLLAILIPLIYGYELFYDDKNPSVDVRAKAYQLEANAQSAYIRNKYKNRAGDHARQYDKVKNQMADLGRSTLGNKDSRLGPAFLREVQLQSKEFYHRQQMKDPNTNYLEFDYHFLREEGGLHDKQRGIWADKHHKSTPADHRKKAQTAFAKAQSLLEPGMTASHEIWPQIQRNLRKQQWHLEQAFKKDRPLTSTGHLAEAQKELQQIQALENLDPDEKQPFIQLQIERHERMREWHRLHGQRQKQQDSAVIALARAGEAFTRDPKEQSKDWRKPPGTSGFATSGSAIPSDPDTSKQQQQQQPPPRVEKPRAQPLEQRLRRQRKVENTIRFLARHVVVHG